jgi:hypothetical protein
MNKIRERLDSQTLEYYLEATQNHLCGRLSKHEFDYVLSSLFERRPELISLHNEHVLDLVDHIANKQGSASLTTFRNAKINKDNMIACTPRDDYSYIDQTGAPIDGGHFHSDFPTEISYDNFLLIMKLRSNQTSIAVPNLRLISERLRLHCEKFKVNSPADDSISRIIWLALQKSFLLC